VEVNIYYQWHRERIVIDIISGQKWKVILRMLLLACHNPEINWKIEEVKIMRCPEEYKNSRGKNRKKKTKNRKKKRNKKKKKKRKKSKKER